MVIILSGCLFSSSDKEAGQIMGRGMELNIGEIYIKSLLEAPKRDCSRGSPSIRTSRIKLELQSDGLHKSTYMF